MYVNGMTGEVRMIFEVTNDQYLRIKSFEVLPGGYAKWADLF